ncbi:MAG TPA: type II toxin-antitoxin system VapC family toxin [Terriglobales bacterium]|nr:type II toxin-antitoxin system VapC family toxin [Terriglobales bacterium]
MKITADTNVLIRAVVRDDEKQARAADRILRSAEIIAVTLPCLCEFFWVLRRLYKFDGRDIGAAIRSLADTENVTLNRPAVEAGLAVLDAGGDFADGLIAYEGNWLHAETFVSFDKKAAAVLARLGYETRLLN